MDDQQSQTPTAAAVVYLPVAQRTPTTFHGETHEDVEDWLLHYERVARHNGWTTEQRLQNLYFSLEGTARQWFENHEASLTSWDSCIAGLKETFTNQTRRQRAEDLLQVRTQGPNETVTSFVEDVLRLSSRADPQSTEEKKLRVLMRGVRSDIFGGLVRNPPSTVEDFVTEATNMERALLARASHYHRHSSVAAASESGYDISSSTPGLRDIIRDIVRGSSRNLSRLLNALPQSPLPRSSETRLSVRSYQMPLSPWPHPKNRR